MAIKIGKVTFRVLRKEEADQLLREGILGDKEIESLKTLYGILTEASRRLIRKQLDELGEIFSAAGQVYGKYREKYLYCIIPDPVVDIGLAYLHPGEGRTEAEARELMITAMKNVKTIIDEYTVLAPELKKEKVKATMGQLGALKKKLQKR